MTQEIALSILKSGHNVFITGAAGTGKTYLLNSFTTYLTENSVEPVIVAPTGIAASHLGGQTIHSFFAIGIREDIDDEFVASLYEKKHLRTRFSKLTVLIIDEISMVSPELFEGMDKILREFKMAFLPFGGVQVVLSGDFFQLPPISKKITNRKFAWQAPVWKELDFRTCYLHKKYRQDDDKLISVLDEIRSGNITEKTHQTLNSVYNKDLDIGFQPTKLYTHNIDVDRINQKELDKIESKSYLFEHKATGTKRHIEKIFKTSLIVEELELKKGAVVIFIKNNQGKNYVNGTIGVVIGFTAEDNFPIVKTPTRKIIASEEDWTIEGDNKKVLAKVTQIPLRLAWAITVHKSQGMSLDVAEIDLSKTFEVGQGYVALSRVINIAGLKLIGLNDMALKVDPLILRIDERIKGASARAEQELSELTKIALNKISKAHLKQIENVKIDELDEKTKKIFDSAFSKLSKQKSKKKSTNLS